MVKSSKFYTYNNGRVQYIYSGYTGLILEYNKRVKRFLETNEVDEDLKKVLLGEESIRVDNTNYQDSYVKNITVICTNFCNLACSYCYNRSNNIDDSKSMNIDTFKNSILYMINNFKYGKFIKIMYFGGEPLLNASFIQDSIVFLQSIEDQYNIKFVYAIATNGTVLNEDIKNLLLKNDFKIQISVDGTRETHDNMRKMLSGIGSYDRIVNNMVDLAKYTEIEARVTLSNYDTDLVELYEHLISMGFGSVNLEISSDRENFIDNEDNLTCLANRLKELANYMINKLENKEVVYFRNFLNHMSNIHNGYHKEHPCIAGINSYTISPSGDVYFCHRFNDLKDFSWGDTFKGIDKIKREEFLHNNSILSRNSECMHCWANKLCGGDCYHTSYIQNDNMEAPSQIHCFFNKEIIRNSMNIYLTLSADARNLLDNINYGSTML